MPRRIQRRRTAGWRMPEGAVYVGHPTRWGNLYRVEILDGQTLVLEGADVVDSLPGRDARAGRARAVALFELQAGPIGAHELDPADIALLTGHDLACWCPLDQPCHADVLLRWANPDEEGPA